MKILFLWKFIMKLIKNIKNMLELFQKIQKYNITPNQCMILFAFDEEITPSNCETDDISVLFNEGYIDKDKSFLSYL